MKRNWYNNEVVVSATLDPAVRTADANATGVDGRGYASVIHQVHMGASGDTLSGSVYVEYELEHSDDNSSWSDCADTDLQNPDTGESGAVTGNNTGTFAKVDDAAEDSTLLAIRYVGTKRYSRVVVNVTGTHTNGFPVGAVALRSGAGAV